MTAEQFIIDDGKFVLGKDNWLFINNDTNGVMRQITGEKRFSPKALTSWGTLLANRKRRLQKQGITYLHVAAPSKECVYADKLPDGILLSEDRPIRQLLAELKSRGEDNLLIYPFEHLLDSRRHRDPYPKGDSHWNGYGGYIAYKTIMSALGMSPIDRKRIDFYDITTKSDLSAKIGQSDIVTLAKITDNQTSRTYNNGIVKVGNLQIFENTDKTLPTAVIFRDSFTAQLIDYLGQHFSKMTLVWQPNIDWSLIETEKPNVVMGIQAERFMTRLPDDKNGLTNAQNVAAKLAKAAAA